MRLASKSSGGPQGDEAAQGHAQRDARDEDEAVAAAGHGARAVDGGHGQFWQAGDLRRQFHTYKTYTHISIKLAQPLGL